jgi:hypothetical protein
MNNLVPRNVSSIVGGCAICADRDVHVGPDQNHGTPDYVLEDIEEKLAAINASATVDARSREAANLSHYLTARSQFVHVLPDFYKVLLATGQTQSRWQLFVDALTGKRLGADEPLYRHVLLTAYCAYRLVAK